MKGVFPATAEMDKERWELLHHVNHTVNGMAIYKADPKGQDRWGAFRLVDGLRVGDCDDYAVHKLQWLIKKGFPRGSLLLSVCWVPQLKQNHCVLLIQEKNKPAICLDNRYSSIWRVHTGGTLGYKWKIQEWPGNGFWWQRMQK